MTRFLFFDNCFGEGRLLWREDGSIIYSYSCFWGLTEQSLLGRSPSGLKTIFYCSVWDSPKPGGPGPRIYILQKQGGPVLPQSTVFPFVASYDSQGLRWRYPIPPPHGAVLHIFIAVLIGIEWKELSSFKSKESDVTNLHRNRRVIKVIGHRIEQGTVQCRYVFNKCRRYCWQGKQL
jgi:hypothetical protein